MDPFKLDEINAEVIQIEAKVKKSQKYATVEDIGNDDNKNNCESNNNCVLTVEEYKKRLESYLNPIQTNSEFPQKAAYVNNTCDADDSEISEYEEAVSYGYESDGMMTRDDNTLSSMKTGNDAKSFASNMSVSLASFPDSIDMTYAKKKVKKRKKKVKSSNESVSSYTSELTSLDLSLHST